MMRKTLALKTTRDYEAVKGVFEEWVASAALNEHFKNAGADARSPAFTANAGRCPDCLLTPAPNSAVSTVSMLAILDDNGKTFQIKWDCPMGHFRESIVNIT